MLRDLELIMQKEKERFSNNRTRWRIKAIHMVDQPSEANQVRLFMRSLQPTYRQHMWFTPFKNFTALRNVGMLVEEAQLR